MQFCDYYVFTVTQFHMTLYDTKTILLDSEPASASVGAGVLIELRVIAHLFIGQTNSVMSPSVYTLNPHLFNRHVMHLHALLAWD